jgi:KDO2-lipid IV(A) lauroyltransferase
MDAETLTERVRFQGIEHWDAARLTGKGFIGLTGHYGNWEAMALALSASGRPLAVIGRNLGNPWLDSRLRVLRTRFGNISIDKSGAMKECIKTLREGMGVGFLLDQDARSNGVFTKFMGQWASTYPTAAALALRFDLPVIPIFSYPSFDGTIIVRAEPALVILRSGDNEKDILTATQLMSTALEHQVRHLPHVWFWMHRRFKTQPSSTNLGEIPIQS